MCLNSRWKSSLVRIGYSIYTLYSYSAHFFCCLPYICRATFFPPAFALSCFDVQLDSLIIFVWYMYHNHIAWGCIKCSRSACGAHTRSHTSLSFNESKHFDFCFLLLSHFLSSGLRNFDMIDGWFSGYYWARIQRGAHFYAFHLYHWTKWLLSW